MLRLSHADKRKLTKKDVIDRILLYFRCKSIIVAKEMHQKTEYHYYAGILCSEASRYTAEKGGFPSYS